jgi:hypothetical protein
MWGLEDVLDSVRADEVSIDDAVEAIDAHTGEIEMRADKALGTLETMRKNLKKFEREVEKWR